MPAESRSTRKPVRRTPLEAVSDLLPVTLERTRGRDIERHTFRADPASGRVEERIERLRSSGTGRVTRQTSNGVLLRADTVPAEIAYLESSGFVRPEPMSAAELRKRMR